eukprot:g4316.t1
MERRQRLKNPGRWVIKIGSALLTKDGLGLDRVAIETWVAQIAGLRQRGYDIVLVSSGSIAEGCVRLGWPVRPTKVHELQAAASVGQMGLIHAYEQEFQNFDEQTGQVLLTHDDLSNRERYLNARSTLETLLDLGVIPVINENDTVVTDEIRFGDNDSLAGLVANLVDADTLVILTDQEGLFEEDPRQNPDARLVTEASATREDLRSMASEEFESGNAPSKKKTQPTSIEDGELSLLDKKGFDEWLAVSSIAYRVDGLLRQEMTHFELRYARLSGYMVDRKTTPYGPETICRLFDEQLRKMELSEAGEEVIHRTMSRVLAEEMATLYNTLNEVVASVDPITRGGGYSEPEESALEKAPVDETASSDDQAADEQKASAGSDAQEQLSHEGSGQSSQSSLPDAASAEGASANDPNIGLEGGQEAGFSQTQQGMRPVPRAQREYSFENLFRAIQRHADVSDERVADAAPRQSAAASYFSPAQAPVPVARSAGGAGTAAGTGAPAGGTVSESAPPVPSGQSIARALSGMRGASSSGRAKAKKAADRAANLPKPETAEVVNLLDQIESKARSRGDGGSSLPLSKRLSRKLEETALAGIEEDDREQLHTVADIMDKAVSEYQPTSQIEALVVALEKPLLKLVLVDSDFLEDEFHPARRFMNTLDQFAIAADDDGNFYDPKLFQFLNGLIDDIVQEPAVSQDIFESSLEKISAMLLQLQQLRLKRVALLQESSEARERVRTARSVTSKALDELLVGKRVPVSALDLLDIGWRHHLNLIELRETSDSETWKDAFDLFVRVCDWLSAERTKEQLTADGALDEGALDELLHDVELGLALVSTDTDGIESFVAAVKSEILISGDDSPEAREHVAAVDDAAAKGKSAQAGIARIG